MLSYKNQNIIGHILPEVLKIPKEDNIAIFYTMIDYKLKVIHDEHDTLNLSAMRQNGKDHTR